MRKQEKTDKAEETTLLPRTFTTGYRSDLELARKLIRDRRNNGTRVRTRVMP